jgi:hypothetical protein
MRKTEDKAGTEPRASSSTMRSLHIGGHNDALEGDADRVADAVMSSNIVEPRWSLSRMSVDAPLQRKCSCGGTGECEECKQAALQRKAGGATSRRIAPEVVHEALRADGEPLAPSARAFMESRFDHDFSRVRVHTGARASQSAQAVNARAYTVGNSIVFKDNEYAPGSLAGARLLAHELAHVVQQERLGGRVQRREEEVDEALEPDATEDYDPSEVYDGDSSVDASSDATSPTQAETPVGIEAPGGAGDTLDRPFPNALTIEAGPESPIEAQKGGGKSPEPKPGGESDPKKKPAATAKTITDIDVDQAAQKMTVTWSDGSKETHNVSTGRGQPNTKDDPCKTQKELNCTPDGSFKVGVRGDANTKNEHGDKMSWYVEFVPGRSIGIHDSQPVPGVPHSHGCVRVGDSPADDAFAKKINKNVVPGSTTINVHGKAPTKPWTKPPPPKKPSQQKK